MMTRALAIEFLVLAVLAAGCAKRPAMTQASAPSPGPAGAAVTSKPSGPAKQVRPAASRPGSTPRAAATRPAPRDFEAVADLRDIHFDFDKYAIRPGDAAILDANAAWLKAHADQALLIEGHCDERGTNEYNLALGERRAKATMNHLVSQGVAASRITILSYGEERPVCTDHDEACWAKNRRAHFLVKPQ